MTWEDKRASTSESFAGRGRSSASPPRKGFSAMSTSLAHPNAVIRWTAVLAATAMACALGSAPAQAAITDPPTVVSLTFDDGNADQAAGVSILDAAGMKGTFFITTGWIDSPDYFTRAQLTSLKNSGHEIAGHTVGHPDLTTVPADELTKQICQGRNTLAEWGFPTTDFAYPFAAVNPAVEAAVQACGFNSARSLGDVTTRFGGTVAAETIPPADAFQTRAPDEVDSTWTLADLQGVVTRAEAAGGGWVQLTFHHVCATACDPLNLTITPTLLQEFVTWLAVRTPSSVGSTTNTVVKTVQQVVGGAVKPLVPSTNTFRAAPGPGVNGVLNPSLETAGTAGQPPQCWQTAGFGISTSAFSTVTNAHTGTAAEQLVVTGYVNGDSKLALTQDLGTCAPTATPGRTYSLRAWYKSTVTTQFDVYYRNAVGGWIYWTSSPLFAAATAYTQATWTTPAVPAGATGLSFGLNLISNGTLVTDDYALYDTVGAPVVVVPDPWSGVPKTSNPITALDVATTGPGSIRLAGWAFDPSTLASISVDVYVDGVGARYQANGSRPDVNAAYGGSGDHGFDITIPAGPGAHSVQAYAIGGNNPLIVNRIMVVPTGSPVGFLDGVTTTATTITASGWTFDPDTAASIPVHVYVDSVGVAAIAAGNRPDVAAVYPGYGAAHGYSTTVAASPGTHRVCAYGINIAGSGQNTELGCKIVTVVIAPPFGFLDQVAAGSRSVTVAGWAIDPKTTASIAVHVYVDAQGTALIANGTRADVANVYRGFGAAHGFSATIPTTAGRHTVCAYAINTIAAGTNVLLGCKVVVALP